MVTDTKTKIIDAALELFARNGYEPTSMSMLADCLEIKAPSLYFHYKNKQTIFDAMVEKMRSYFWEAYPHIHDSGNSLSELAKQYTENTESAKKDAVKTFLFYYKDKYAGTFRRLLTIERYKNAQMNMIFRELYIDAPIKHQTELISEMIKQGYMPQNINPHTAACELYSPIFFLLNKYDCMPECEKEAIGEVEAHITQYLNTYLSKQ